MKPITMKPPSAKLPNGPRVQRMKALAARLRAKAPRDPQAIKFATNLEAASRMLSAMPPMPDRLVDTQREQSPSAPPNESLPNVEDEKE